MSDLEQVIQDSIDDATAPAEDSTPEVDSTPDASVEAAPAEESAEPVADEAPVEAEPASPEGVVTKGSPDEEFAKKHGLNPQLPGQRENRLPYSRVKKIVENAERKAIEPLSAKVKEYETKFQAQEARLSEVGKFEQLMVNDHMGFLNLLAERIPGYAEALQYIASQGAQQAQPAQEQKPTKPEDDDMPQPDYKMPDGSMVYSLEGLKARDAWNRAQATKAALAEVDKKYGFVAEERQAQQYYRQLAPKVDAQIQEARQWEGWEATQEFEDKIAEVLARNPSWNLERAYQSVMIPKWQEAIKAAAADRVKVKAEARQEVLKEIKRAPSTSVPTGGVKPGAQSQSGNKSLEQIIKESIDASGLR